MPDIQHLSVSKEHMHAAGETGVETSYSAHDVDTFEVFGSVFFKDRRILHGVFIRTGGAVDIAHRSVPWSRRIRMVVCDFSIADDHVMREDAANRFVESTTNCILRNFKFSPGFCTA